MDDDEMANSGAAEERRGGNGKFDGLKKKRKEDFNKVSDDDYKGVNTVFTKPINKIMFDIQNKPYCEWPRLMGGNTTARNSKLRCSYNKDHGHRIENCKTLKQFLEGLVLKGRLAEYIKGAEKAKKGVDDDEDDEDPSKRHANKLVTGVIDAILASIYRETITKHVIRVHIKMV